MKSSFGEAQRLRLGSEGQLGGLTVALCDGILPGSLLSVLPLQFRQQSVSDRDWGEEGAQEEPGQRVAESSPGFFSSSLTTMHKGV